MESSQYKHNANIIIGHAEMKDPGVPNSNTNVYYNMMNIAYDSVKVYLWDQFYQLKNSIYN